MPFNHLISGTEKYLKVWIAWDFFVMTAVEKLNLFLSSLCFHLFPTQAKLLLISVGGASAQTL